MSLVAGLGSGDDRGVGDQGEVDPGKRNQVGLELVEVNVKSSKRCKIVYLFKDLVFTPQIGERQSRMKRPKIVNRLNLYISR